MKRLPDANRLPAQSATQRPVHGGALREVARGSDIPLDNWIDLSTGISPWNWPLPEIPDAVWQRLPENDGALEASAARYYKTRASQLLAAPGSQWAISQLPGQITPGAVALPRWGYAEHAHAWRRAGHRPVYYRDLAALRQLAQRAEVDHAVVINPNNPSAEFADRETLRQLARDLAGTLLVDEAFLDCSPGHSMAADSDEQVIVLRSLGKFFGLAGLRLGFVFAGEFRLRRLAAALDPWAVNHPARWLGTRALADSAWHALQRERLQAAAARWQSALAKTLPDWQWRATALFCSAPGSAGHCAALQRACLARGLYIRNHAPGGNEGMVRLGLPSDAQWPSALGRLAAAAGELV